MDDLWVFGYGSLMWRPGFRHAEVVPALLRGLHRSLCVYSWVHRGTQERPGLVLGLDRGGACRGLAFRVEAEHRDEVIAYLRAREQVTMVYREVLRDVVLGDGRRIQALGYVVERGHEQYAGALPLERQLEIVRESNGQSGPNRDYVLNTADHLKELGIKDRHLSWLADALRAAG
ncbi:gamma-glutamylcyclotransferase [Breoghania sp. JC706]|uniref:gamma-glutamylcyclotransferase n=1 Tax=Breoghania sp. JC706 TaxID=3117732 RepID=UPI003008945A